MRRTELVSLCLLRLGTLFLHQNAQTRRHLVGVSIPSPSFFPRREFSCECCVQSLYKRHFVIIIVISLVRILNVSNDDDSIVCRSPLPTILPDRGEGKKKNRKQIERCRMLFLDPIPVIPIFVRRRTYAGEVKNMADAIAIVGNTRSCPCHRDHIKRDCTKRL